MVFAVAGKEGDAAVPDGAHCHGCAWLTEGRIHDQVLWLLHERLEPGAADQANIGCAGRGMHARSLGRHDWREGLVNKIVLRLRDVPLPLEFRYST